MTTMMIRALVIPPPSVGTEGSYEPVSHGGGGGGGGLLRCSSSKRLLNVVCSSSRNDANIPKLKPFSRSLLERALKEPPLIQKAVNEISDYCTTLEGDDCYSCWRAYFELKDLEWIDAEQQVAPKEELERTIVESDGLTSLISSIHRAVSIYGLKKAEPEVKKAHAHAHVPDGLPRTAEEVEEDEEAKMADSPHTRLLRVMGKFPAWYTPAPDHQTD